MSTKEIWKDIPNYEGYYQVSNTGKVKSIERKVKHSHSGWMTIKERELKSRISGRDYKKGEGYYQVVLHNGIGKRYYGVHVLVAMAFLSHAPSGHKIIVDHIDDNKLNNKLDNLQLITSRYNCSRSKRNKTSKYVGVTWHKINNKWTSRIYINGENKYLGQFDCELAAAKAYQDKLKEIDGNLKSFLNIEL
jgi:hypothetical protein